MTVDELKIVFDRVNQNAPEQNKGESKEMYRNRLIAVRSTDNTSVQLV